VGIISKQPQISVIVPAYGVAHLLADALGSLQAQSHADWEAVVVDDGAPDDVEGALRPFAGDPRIRFLKTGNAGPSAARNRAIAQAHAPLVAFLDGDDMYEPAYVEKMLAAFARAPHCDLMTCDATYFGASERAGRRFSEFHPQRGEATLARVIRREFNIFIGSTVRREALATVAGFDEGLRSSEDLDLWLRLLVAGYRCGLVAEPLVRYRRRPGSLTTDVGTMLATGRRVYSQLAERLAGRPEQQDALAMLAALRAQYDWSEGERLILQGDTRTGLALLQGADQRSLRWRIALPVMRVFPGLARPMLRLRPSLPEPSPR
jgi:glycosyltransferase involved in cell wall biosynthesis